MILILSKPEHLILPSDADRFPLSFRRSVSRFRLVQSITDLPCSLGLYGLIVALIMNVRTSDQLFRPFSLLL